MEQSMTVEKNPKKIKDMFDDISIYYDYMNNFISFGTHWIVKYLSIKELNIQPRSMILDLCCGTGDFTGIISKFFPRAKVIGLDFSEKMLKMAKSKNPNGVFVKGDCINLPFHDEEFDYVTIGFGLRNIESRDKAIRESYRVLKRGGKFLHLDFGVQNIISKMFDFIVLTCVKILQKDVNHYKYLLESKKQYPIPELLIKEFEASGYKCIKKCDYLFGVISAQVMQK